jgi:RNA-splicing ligase RtcB
MTGSCLGKISIEEQDEIMRKGMQWCEDKGYCWPSDRAFVEESGAFEVAAFFPCLQHLQPLLSACSPYTACRRR